MASEMNEISDPGSMSKRPGANLRSPIESSLGKWQEVLAFDSPRSAR